METDCIKWMIVLVFVLLIIVIIVTLQAVDHIGDVTASSLI
jgi:hypothetical protein